MNRRMFAFCTIGPALLLLPACGGGNSGQTNPLPPPPAVTAACTINGANTSVTTLVGSLVAYNANPNPASGSTCDWNPGTPSPGAFDTAAGSSCAPSSPTYTATAGGVFSESVTVTNGSNSVTSNCPTLTVQDFNLSLLPSSGTIAPGGVFKYSVTASSIDQFTGQVNFAQSTVLPANVSAAWSPASQFCTVPAGGACSASYTVTVGSGAIPSDTGLAFASTFAQALLTRNASSTLHVRAAPTSFQTTFTNNMPWQSAGSIAAGRFNADGFIDLAVTDLLPNQVHILFGSGVSGFPSQSSLDLQAISVAAGDFSGDGRTDLAFTTLPQGTSSTQVSVWTGDGQGNFNSQWTYSFGNNSPCQQSGQFGALAVGDLNNDGNPDLIVGHAGFSVFLGTGSQMPNSLMLAISAATPASILRRQH